MTQTSYDSSPHLARPKVHAAGGSTLMRLLRRQWAFLLFVVAPTLVSGVYLGAFAADQYVSEARFTVRSASQTETPSLLGLVMGGAGTSLANSEAYSVADYLESHDAVRSLEKDLDLVKLYRRPEADPIFRLWWSDPTQERLLDYYQRMVNISFDSQSNIAILKVNAFRREDAERIAQRLLDLGEARVNDFSKRAEQNTIDVANRQVQIAEARVAQTETDLTSFRIRQQTLDPSKSAATLFAIVGGLEAQLAAGRAELSAQSSYLSTSSPQYQALTQRIAAIQKQIDSETDIMTGPGKKALAPVLAEYEQLSLQREFAGREYTTALSSLESARMQALKQHLFVTRVVEPNLPDQSIYPRRILTTLTVFLVTLVLYGIGWLIYAGTKEHAA